MSEIVKIIFAPFSAPDQGALVVFVGADLKLGKRTTAHVTKAEGFLRGAAETLAFKSKSMSAMDLIRPQALAAERLLVVGVAAKPDDKPIDFVNLGGYVAGKLPKAKTVHVLFEAPEDEWSAEAASDFALGYRLRNYKFDKYKAKKPDDDEKAVAHEVTLLVADPEAVRRAYAHREAVAEGVELARNLVNEPPNVLFPESFADRAEDLQKLGVDVEIIDDKAMAKLGMGALLAVGQGSKRGSRFVVMRWQRREVEEDGAGRDRRQGRVFRHRRHLDQAGAPAWRT